MEAETDWYLTSSEAKHVRQIVVHLPAEAQVPSRVEGCLIGPMSRAVGKTWAATTSTLPGDTPEQRGPFLLAKANGVIELLQGCPARVAFSFYRFQAGGLLQIYLHVPSRAVEQRHSSYIVENTHWPDADDTKELIPELIGRDHLEVCFLAHGRRGPCEGFFGLRVPLPQDLRAALNDEWKALNDHHASVPPSQRSRQEAMSQFGRENPAEENPILERAAEAKPGAPPPGEKPGGGKRWWKPWS
ncbi:MAG: hypothetical protein HY315_09100 [Acidobacteria bacterium]|nr:hypothetical protein [Acidobacteriota bacterium]